MKFTAAAVSLALLLPSFVSAAAVPEFANANRRFGGFGVCSVRFLYLRHVHTCHRTKLATRLVTATATLATTPVIRVVVVHLLLLLPAPPALLVPPHPTVPMLKAP